jgi:hypothetical protein
MQMPLISKLQCSSLNESKEAGKICTITGGAYLKYFQNITANATAQ